MEYKQIEEYQTEFHFNFILILTLELRTVKNYTVK